MATPSGPLVSIVTPSYNMARFLRETIRSVLAQDYPRIEYIVMDGGSTDGTIELLKSQSGSLRYFSGKDEGPSDAAHRGFREAKGDILAWLNADDVYLPGAVRTAVNYLNAHPEVDVVYGEGNWIDDEGNLLGRYPSLPFDAKTLERDCFICQPASFFRSAAYQQCQLDPSINMSFDYDLWIRMSKQGFHFAFLSEVLACTRMHKDALTLGKRDEVFRASMALLKRHYGYVPFQWVFGYAAYRIDGRDQFFLPLRPSILKYLASLPAGFRYNPTRRLRFLGEWIAAPLLAIRRLAIRLSSKAPLNE